MIERSEIEIRILAARPLTADEMAAIMHQTERAFPDEYGVRVGVATIRQQTVYSDD